MQLSDRERRAFVVGVLAALYATLAMVVLRLLLGIPSLPEALADVFLGLLPIAVFAFILDTLGKAAKYVMYVGFAIGQLVVGGAIAVYYARRMRPGWFSGLIVWAVLWAVFAALVFPLLGLGPLASSLDYGPALCLFVLPLAFAVYAAYLVWGTADLVPDARPWMAHLNSPERMALSRREFVTKSGLGLAAFAVGLVAWRVRAPRSAASPLPAGVAEAQGAAAPAAGGAAAAQTGSAAAAAGAPPAPGRPAQPAGGASPGGAPAPGAPSSDPAFQIPGLSPEVTTNAAHYVVSKNLLDPSVDVTAWNLTLDGRVKTPLTFTYGQLIGLPQTSRYYTLQCISNEVGGDLESTAKWTGIPLKQLLEQAGPLDGVVDVELHGADDYVDSIPFERAMHPDNLIAFRMNDVPLPPGHGYPARLLVPGIYGMKNVKWLTKISLVPTDILGFWQRQGWDDTATYKTSSRIDVPQNGGDVQPGAKTAGVAFAGDRGISKVEVSYDDGQTWHATTLKTPPLSPYTWVLWETPIPANAFPNGGGGTITVRATDGTGAVQTAEVASTAPDGASGYHQIAVRVA